MAHLYVMSYASNDQGPYKIGRSKDIKKRIRKLEESHIFRMRLDAVFPNKGHLEREIHSLLAPFRVEGFNCREWYDAPLSTILRTIARVIDLYSKSLVDEI